jgi:hypothetical protein
MRRRKKLQTEEFDQVTLGHYQYFCMEATTTNKRSSGMVLCALRNYLIDAAL